MAQRNNRTNQSALNRANQLGRAGATVGKHEIGAELGATGAAGGLTGAATTANQRAKQTGSAKVPGGQQNRT